MIKKVIIIDESDWNRLTLKIAQAVWDQYDVGYGFKLVRNDDGGTVASLNEVIGTLTLPISHAVDELTKGAS